MGLAFEVLGPLRVAGAGVGALRRPSHRRLLSILLLDAGRRLSTDVLIDRFWGDQPPPTAKAAVQTHISALRRLLVEPAIVTEGYGYRLLVDGHRIDAVEFAAAAVRAHQHATGNAWDTALHDAEVALGMWRGEPFAALRDDGFARPEITRLEELHVGLLEIRARALLALGRASDALPELERLTAAHPLRERPWADLMLARQRLGRHAEAAEAYRSARRALAEVGLEPGDDLRRLEARILRGVGDHPDGNLPIAITRFVGRDREVAEVLGLLRRHRVVTLTGVGGAGKTRLALRVGEGAAEVVAGGCWLVSLEAVSDPGLVAAEVAGVLGALSPGRDVEESLRTFASSREVLVVLDNCEHLPEAPARVAHLLVSAGHGARVLATSRQPLGLTGEVVYEVPPLSAPPSDLGEDPAGLRRYDAVRLFEDRAGLVRPGYVVGPADGPAVADICRALDGVPLAIELAAARMRVLEPRTIADRLGDRFRLLTGGGGSAPPRQRTLEAAVAWSYDLLSPAEQDLFRRISVFRGTFDLAMIAALTAGGGPAGGGPVDGDVVDLVADLVDRSLVVVTDTEVGRRFRLLETLRAYAGERLAEAGDVDDVHERHRQWCVAFADGVRRRLRRAEPPELLARLAAVVDDLQAALDRSVRRGDDPAASALAHALAVHWSERGHLALATAYLEDALARCRDPEEEIRLTGRLAAARYNAGDVAAAWADSHRAHDAVREATPSLLRGEVLLRHAQMHTALVDRDAADAVPLAREVLDIAETLGHRELELKARTSLADALAWSGEPDESLAHMRAVLRLVEADGDLARVLEHQERLYNVLYLHPVERRHGPGEAADRFRSWLEDRVDATAVQAALDAVPWLVYVDLQRGDWSRAEAQILRVGERHLEGFERTYHLMQRCTLQWMQGRLDEARGGLEELDAAGVNPRWYHDYYPLRADVAADLGDLAEVHRSAEAYLRVEVHASEEAGKLGVLAAVVRAEVDAALRADRGSRREHEAEARGALDGMRDHLQRHPPPTGGSVQLEAPATHLALAEAEWTRTARPDPHRWQEVVERADYVYTRLYARWRLAEALIAAGRRRQGATLREDVRRQASRLGAERIRDAAVAPEPGARGGDGDRSGDGKGSGDRAFSDR